MFRLNKDDNNNISYTYPTFGLVGVRVDEPRGLSGLPADEAVEVGALLVLASGLHRVALAALLNEDLLALLDVVAHLDGMGVWRFLELGGMV